MCCILCVCIYVITLYCIYGMFLIDYGTPVLFKSLFLKLFIKALLSRLLDTSAIEIHYYYYPHSCAPTVSRMVYNIHRYPSGCQLYRDKNNYIDIIIIYIFRLTGYIQDYGNRYDIGREKS